MSLKARLADVAHVYCQSNSDKSDFYLHRQHFKAGKIFRNNDYCYI